MTVIFFVNKNKNKENEADLVIAELSGLDKISSVVNDIYSDYIDGRATLIGKKISHGEAEEALSKIHTDLILKMPNYDGFEVTDEYYYYEVSYSDLASYGIGKFSDTYIVNFLTGEVICTNVDENTEQYDAYNYTRDFSTTNILGDSVQTYTITYDLDGGIEDEYMANINSYNETMKFNLYIPTKQDYIFVGWVGSNGEEPQDSVIVDYGTTGNLHYTAVWEKVQEENAEKAVV